MGSRAEQIEAAAHEVMRTIPGGKARNDAMLYLQIALALPAEDEAAAAREVHPMLALTHEYGEITISEDADGSVSIWTGDSLLFGSWEEALFAAERKAKQDGGE